MSLLADVMDRDGDLAVGSLARRASVLPLEADGVLALLGEAGVVDDEGAPRTGDLAHTYLIRTRPRPGL